MTMVVNGKIKPVVLVAGLAACSAFAEETVVKDVKREYETTIRYASASPGAQIAESDVKIDVQEIGFSWGVPVGQALSSAPVVNGISTALPAIEAKIAKLKPLVAKIQKQYEILITDIDARRVPKEWSDLHKFMGEHAKLQQSKTGKWNLSDWELKSEVQGARNRELTLLEVIRLQTKSADVKRRVEKSLKTKRDGGGFYDKCMQEAQRLVNGKKKRGKPLDSKKQKDPI